LKVLLSFLFDFFLALSLLLDFFQMEDRFDLLLAAQQVARPFRPGVFNFLPNLSLVFRRIAP